MTDLARAMSEIRSLPDEALQRELSQPSGMAPGFLVMSELRDRQALRNGGSKTPRLNMAQELLQGFASKPAQQGYAEGGLIAATNPFLALIESMQNPETAGQLQQELINNRYKGLPPLMPLQPLGQAAPVAGIDKLLPKQPGRLLTPDAVGGIGGG